MTAAPINGPQSVPMPPMMTMARTRIDWVNRKVFGNTAPCSAANSEPANPENEAPMANAQSFAEVVLMPTAEAAISSSRTATQARPIREATRRWATKTESSRRIRIR